MGPRRAADVADHRNGGYVHHHPTSYSLRLAARQRVTYRAVRDRCRISDLRVRIREHRKRVVEAELQVLHVVVGHPRPRGTA